MFSFLTEPPPALSKEEAEKAQEVLASEANDDDFKDALEDEEHEVDGNFPVSPEELAIIRAELASDFPEDYQYMSDAYVLSVASKPYSKDPSKRRPLEVGDTVSAASCSCSVHSECPVANGAFLLLLFLDFPLSLYCSIPWRN
jgi:hypothetical protein